MYFPVGFTVYILGSVGGSVAGSVAGNVGGSVGGSVSVGGDIGGDKLLHLFLPLCSSQEVTTGHYKDHYVGHDARRLHRVLTLQHPVQRGVVTDWDLMEKVGYHESI